MRRKVVALLTAAVAALTIPTFEAGADQELHGKIVKGKILEAYHRVGGYARLGNAKTDELNAARGGKFQVFERASSIYWHPNVDNGTAHQVEGRIRDKWRDLKWENGFLKYPLTDESVTPDGVGRFNHFEGGSIYWSPSTDAHEVHGSIRDRWSADGWERGELKYPVTDESGTPDGVGRFNHFQGGSIYWHPSYGPKKVKGLIRKYWGQQGWEQGRFGYPVSEEEWVGRHAVEQRFSKGRQIQWIWSTDRQLPKYNPNTEAHYEMVIPFDPPGNENWSPMGMNREVLTHFNNYFPIAGCPDRLYVGLECKLHIRTDVLGVLENPVRVVAVSDRGFTLRSLEGHSEGKDRLINFSFEKGFDSSDPSRARLRVQAWGPKGGLSRLGVFNEILANYFWARFGSEMHPALTSSTTAYLSDENFRSRSRRSIETPEYEPLSPGALVLTEHASQLRVETSPNGQLESVELAELIKSNKLNIEADEDGPVLTTGRMAAVPSNAPLGTSESSSSSEFPTAEVTTKKIDAEDLGVEGDEETVRQVKQDAEIADVLEPTISEKPL